MNEQVVHGIPTRRKLVEGDLLKLDYGVIKHGYYGDSARTVAVARSRRTPRGSWKRRGSRWRKASPR